MIKYYTIHYDCCGLISERLGFSCSAENLIGNIFMRCALCFKIVEIDNDNIYVEQANFKKDVFYGNKTLLIWRL